MIRPFTAQDVKRLFFSIHSTKSPVYDGFSSEFLKASWAQVGEDVSKAVLHFFYRGQLLIKIDHIVLLLFPKTGNSHNALDYRRL